MSRSTKGIWLVIAGGVAAGIGFAVYYITVVVPRADAATVQREVATWTRAWTETRACLVGDPPEAASGYDAIVLREAIAGARAEHYRPCTAGFKNLQRPGDSRSDSAEIETDWEDLRRGLTALANAHALRVDRNATQRAEQRREGLGTALENVDAAYAKLRRDAKLRAAPQAGRGRLREVESPPVVSVNGKPVTATRADRFGNALLVQGPVDGTTTLAVVRGPTTQDLRAIAVGVKRAASRTPWGTWRADTKHVRQLRAGALGADGKAANKGVLVASTDRWRETLDVVYALGDGQDRVVVYWVARETPKRFIRTLWAARSRDGGASFPERIQIDPADGSRLTLRRDWGSGRLDMLWRGPGKPLRWLVLRPAQLGGTLTPTVLERVDDGDAIAPPKQCHSGATTWWAFRSASKTELRLVAGAGRSEPKRVATIDGTLSACTDSQVLVESFTPAQRTLSVCSATRCEKPVTIPVASGGAFRATIGPTLGPIAATLTNDLLVLWTATSSAEPTQVVRLAEPGALHSLYEWNGVAYAAVRVDNAIHLIAFDKADKQSKE